MAGFQPPHRLRAGRPIEARSRERGPHGRPSLGYEIAPTLGVVRIDLIERLDVPQLAHAFDLILRDPAFQPGFHLCVNCRRLRGLPSRETLFAAGAEVRGLGLGWRLGRVGIIVARPSSDVARCLPMVLPAGLIARTRMVANLSEAMRWFDIKPATPTAS